MDIVDTLPDDPFGAVVNVSDKVPTATEPTAYFSPKYFRDNVLTENDLIPIHNPTTGAITHAAVANSGDEDQKRIRLSDGFEGFEPGVDQAVVDFNPVHRGERDASLPSNVSEYKRFLIEKITGGAQDYTYGPGSPGATSSDMRQTVGARDNRLQTGQVALPPEDYNLFTPEEREQYGIADTSWFTPGRPTPRGSVERYYGPEARGQDLRAQIGQYPKIAGDMTAESVEAAGPNGLRPVDMDAQGTVMWSDGSKVYQDGTVSRRMGNSIRFTSPDGKNRWANVDPAKQPIPPVPKGITYDSSAADKDAALSKLSQSDQVAVKEYAEDKRSPMTLRGRVDTAYTRLAPYVGLYQNGYDPSAFPLKQQTKLEFGTTKANTPGGQVRSFNQALIHMGSLWDKMQKLPMDDKRLVNEFKNAISKYVKGEPYVTDAEQQLGFVVNEVGRALKGSAIDQADINRMLSQISVAGSKAQIESNIKNVLATTIEGGLEALNGAYKGTMNQDFPDDRLLYPQAKAALKKFGYDTFAERPIGGQVAKETKPTAKDGTVMEWNNKKFTVGETYGIQGTEYVFGGLDDNGIPIWR